jgi:two-component system, response regulator PdtaR
MSEKELHQQPVILVVEDEELIRLMAVDILENTGFSVLEAEDAQTALSILEARPDVRLLFTDLQMPGALDGMELARRVHERWPNVRLILTSGRSEARRAEIPDDGCFIAKPYWAEQLVGQVQDLLRG